MKSILKLFIKLLFKNFSDILVLRCSWELIREISKYYNCKSIIIDMIFFLWYYFISFNKINVIIEDFFMFKIVYKVFDWLVVNLGMVMVNII